MWPPALPSIGAVVELAPQLLGLLHAEGIDFAPPGGAVRGPRAICSARGECIAPDIKVLPVAKRLVRTKSMRDC